MGGPTSNDNEIRREWFAHSRNSQGVRHDLVTHLSEVANLAALFAETFSAREPAYYAGLWHDVGKFPEAFQHYLRDCEADPERKTRGPDHKAAGATLAAQHLGLAALTIQGHHGGLKSLEEFRSWLDARGKEADVSEALTKAAATLPDLTPHTRPLLPTHVGHDRLSAEFFVRMLFSALVDARLSFVPPGELGSAAFRLVQDRARREPR